MIYFARLKSGSIKIGYTGNVQTRLGNLNTEFGCMIELLHVIPGTLKTEKEIHRRFDHLRFKGTEQFRPAPDLFEFMGIEMPSDMGPDATEQKKKVRYLKIPEEYRIHLDRLSKTWWPLLPISHVDVMRECIRRFLIGARLTAKKNSRHLS